MRASRRQTLLLLLTSLVGCIPAPPPSEPPVEPPVEPPAPESWKPTGPLEFERAGHHAVTLPDGRVLVVGGITTESQFVYQTELYDPATGLWSLSTALPRRTGSGHTVTELPSGRVLLAGGLEYRNIRTDFYGLDGYQYDPATATWQPFAVNPLRGDHRAVALLDGRVLFTGGETPTWDPKWGSTVGPVKSTSLYDPDTNTWSETGSLADPVRHGSTAVRLADGKVLVAGGFEAGKAKATAEVYDPATGTWSPTGDMPLARSSMQGVVLPSGQVLLMGGLAVPTTDCRADALLYDPATNQWRALAPLAQSRAGHTATLLPDGRVLVAGGFVNTASGRDQALASTELYDPATGTWSAGLPMTTQRTYHTATLLPSGDVLVTGGYMTLTGYQIPQATAELYHPGPRP